jgi:hypothetical protein
MQISFHHWQNDTDGKTCPNAISSTTDLTCTGLVSHLALRNFKHEFRVKCTEIQYLPACLSVNTLMVSAVYGSNLCVMPIVLCGHNAQCMNVKAGGTDDYHYDLNN